MVQCSCSSLYGCVANSMLYHNLVKVRQAPGDGLVAPGAAAWAQVHGVGGLPLCGRRTLTRGFCNTATRREGPFHKLEAG